MSPIKQKLFKLKNPIKAKLLAGFFKIGRGQYGEGDIFWGINVPEQRKVAKEFLAQARDGVSFGMSVETREILQELLEDPVHECRLTALLVLTYMYERLQKIKSKNIKDINLVSIEKKKIFDFYLKNLRYINNWDLVDVTCPRIVGAYLCDKKDKRTLLYKMANSKKLWEKRIAIVSTFYFIRKSDFSDTLKIAEILLNDKHDLIHKAVGWALREVGKKDEIALHNFLKKHHGKMARTTLRYAIERLPEEFRRHYMKL